jgi:hypothetical protein
MAARHNFQNSLPVDSIRITVSRYQELEGTNNIPQSSEFNTKCAQNKKSYLVLFCNSALTSTIS